MQQHNWQEFLNLHLQPDILTYISEPLSVDDIQAKFNKSLACWEQPENWHNLLIFNKGTNQFIGTFAFRISNLLSCRAEIGYLAMNHMQGKGYVTEAGLAVIASLFKHVVLKKIEAFCSTDNVASVKVLEKLQLSCEGELTDDHLVGEQWQNSYVYGRINSNFS